LMLSTEKWVLRMAFANKERDCQMTLQLLTCSKSRTFRVTWQKFGGYLPYTKQAGVHCCSKNSRGCTCPCLNKIGERLLSYGPLWIRDEMVNIFNNTVSTKGVSSYVDRPTTAY
jgi:hypothetical protein